MAEHPFDRRAGILGARHHTARRSSGKPLTTLQVLPALGRGAAERGALEIAQATAQAGGRAVVASSGGRLANWFRQSGADLRILPLQRKNLLALWRNARVLADLMRAENVDLVHAHSRGPAWSAHWAARRVGVPLITTWSEPHRENMPFKRAYNAIMARGDVVIAPSAFIAARIAAAAPEAGERVRIIRRGVDLRIYDEAAVTVERVARLAAEWRMEDDARPVFLAPMRLTRGEGCEAVVDAAAELRRRLGPTFLVLAAGDDAEDPTRAARLEARVRARKAADVMYFVGRSADMAAAYRLSSCVIAAGGPRGAASMTAIEAQAMARPVIAFDHGDAREIVDPGETGWLAAPRNAREIADAMAAFLAGGDSAAAAMGAAGRAKARRAFSIEQFRAQTLAVYEEVAGRAF